MNERWAPVAIHIEHPPGRQWESFMHEWYQSFWKESERDNPSDIKLQFLQEKCIFYLKFALIFSTKAVIELRKFLS